MIDNKKNNHRIIEATKMAEKISNSKKDNKNYNHNKNKIKKVFIWIFSGIIIALITVIVTHCFNTIVPEHSPLEEPELQEFSSIRTFICSANGETDLPFAPVNRKKDAFLHFKIYNPNKEDHLIIDNASIEIENYEPLSDLLYTGYSGNGGEDDFIRGYTKLDQQDSKSEILLLNKKGFIEFDAEYTKNKETDPSKFEKIDYIDIGPGEKDVFLINLSAKESGKYDVVIEVNYSIRKKTGTLKSKEKSFIAGTTVEMKAAGFPRDMIN